jgi:serine/threonine protein kinase
VRWLSDQILDHLRKVGAGPDLAGTRYELMEKIGQGGMATVYLAHDRELDRPVALKILNDLPKEAQAETRLVREARIIARLEHPGIVPVHDSGVLPDGRFYYAMKLVRGKRLDQQVDRSTPLPQRLGLCQKICDAVGFAHAHGVIHRDLKPQNIMVGPFGEVLVMDWGVAKQGEPAAAEPVQDEANGVPASPGGTLHGTVLGTPGYMAPEQARGDADVDEGIDVYSLGAILYFLLTGQGPAPCDSTAVAQHVIPPRQVDRSIPRPLEAICLKAMAGDRAQRYANVPQLADDIASFLAGSRVLAYPEGPLDAAWRLASKYRAAVALILTYVIVRILLLIFAGV